MAENQDGKKNRSEIKNSMSVCTLVNKVHLSTMRGQMHGERITAYKCTRKFVGVWLGEVKIKDEEKCLKQE